jgi:hypothetical protein
MALFVSNKAQTVNTNPTIKRSFQQIERATIQQWQPMTLSAGWANTVSLPSRQSCEWRKDFSGFVHLRGTARLAGTILNGATSVVATTTLADTIPAAGGGEIFIVWGGSDITLRLDIFLSGALYSTGDYQVTNNTGGTLTDPYCSFSGITYDTML